MKKVALKLKDIKPEELIIRARNIHSCMTFNAVTFSTPPLPMADLLAQIDELEAAQIDTYDGGKSATVIRNQKRATVKESLVKLSWYVNGVSNGDEAIMNMAGMAAVNRAPYRYESIARPVNLRGIILYEGVVKLRWSPVKGASAYIVENCPDPITGTEWKNCFSSKSAHAAIGGLESMKKYWFRVRAIGAGGLMSDWSDPICILIR